MLVTGPLRSKNLTIITPLNEFVANNGFSKGVPCSWIWKRDSGLNYRNFIMNEDGDLFNRLKQIGSFIWDDRMEHYTRMPTSGSIELLTVATGVGILGSLILIRRLLR